MPRTVVIYISGPYRDPRGEYYVRQNIRRAEDLALQVWAWGGVALCPHKNTAGFGGAHGLTSDDWLNGDFELVSRSDAIAMVPGWDNSEGARAEKAVAEVLGIPVFHPTPRQMWLALERFIRERSNQRTP